MSQKISFRHVLDLFATFFDLKWQKDPTFLYPEKGTHTSSTANPCTPPSQITYSWSKRDFSEEIRFRTTIQPFEVGFL